MKTILAVAICLALALDSHAQTTDVTPDQKAMLTVRDLRARMMLAFSRVTIDRGRIVQMQVHGADFLQALKKIDTGACPKNFQLAWFDYISAWDDRVTKDQRTARDGLIAIIGGLTGAAPIAWGEMEAMAKSVEGDGKTLDAWRAVERAALEDGLDLTKK